MPMILNLGFLNSLQHKKVQRKKVKVKNQKTDTKTFIGIKHQQNNNNNRAIQLGIRNQFKRIHHRRSSRIHHHNHGSHPNGRGCNHSSRGSSHRNGVVDSKAGDPVGVVVGQVGWYQFGRYQVEQKLPLRGMVGGLELGQVRS